MSQESFGLIIDAVLLALEKGLVEDPQETTKALEFWTAKILNEKQDLFIPNWQDAPYWAKWWAMDSDGEAFFFAKQPLANDGTWEPEFYNELFDKSHDYLVNYWQESLTERPKK